MVNIFAVVKKFGANIDDIGNFMLNVKRTRLEKSLFSVIYLSDLVEKDVVVTITKNNFHVRNE